MQKIIVVEPHPLLRMGLIQLLADIVPASVLSGADYAQMSQHSPEDAEAALVLLASTSFDDISRLAELALSAYAPQAILLLSDDDEMPTLPQGFPDKVAGYVSRHASPQVLLASVRLILAGGTCFPISNSKHRNEGLTLSRLSASLGQTIPDSIEVLSNIALDDEDVSLDLPETSAKCHASSSESSMLGLTPRQYEVLILLARGHSMKMVGRQLNISAATAKAHAEALYQRLDVHNRNAAVYAAVSRGATLGWPSITAAAHEVGSVATASIAN